MAITRKNLLVGARQVPSEPVRADTNHSLSRALRSLWIPAQNPERNQLINLAPDLVRGNTALTLYNSGVPTYTTTQTGVTASFNGNSSTSGGYINSSGKVPYSPNVDGVGAVTIAALVTWTGAQVGGFPSFYGIAETAGNGFCAIIPNSGVIAYDVGLATGEAVLSGPTPTTGQDYLVIATSRTNIDHEALFVDLSTGIVTRVTSTTNAGTNVAKTFNNEFLGYATYNAVNHPLVGNVGAAWCWARGFTSAELTQFITAPFDNLVPIKQAHKAPVPLASLDTSAINDDFSGTAADLNTRSGWVAVGSGSVCDFATNGTGQVRWKGVGDGQLVVTQAGSPNQYMEVVLGSGYIANPGKFAMYVRANNRSGVGFYVDYDGTTLRTRANSGAAMDSWNGTLATNDVLRIEIDTEMRVYVNGTLRITSTSSTLAFFSATKYDNITTCGIYSQFNLGTAVNNVFESIKAGSFDSVVGRERVVTDTFSDVPNGTAIGGTTRSLIPWHPFETDFVGNGAGKLHGNGNGYAQAFAKVGTFDRIVRATVNMGSGGTSLGVHLLIRMDYDGSQYTNQIAVGWDGFGPNFYVQEGGGAKSYKTTGLNIAGTSTDYIFEAQQKGTALTFRVYDATGKTVLANFTHTLSNARASFTGVGFGIMEDTSGVIKIDNFQVVQSALVPSPSVSTIYDDFNGLSSAADLNGRTPLRSNGSATWNRYPGCVVQANGNGGVTVDNAASAAYLSINSGQADIDIAVDMVCTSSLERSVLYAANNLTDGPTKSSYMVFLDPASSNWRFFKFDAAGSRTDLVNTTLSGISVGATYRLRFTVTGTNPVVLAWYLDGNLVGTYTDSSSPFTSRAIVGFGTYFPAANPLNNLVFDNFTAATTSPLAGTPSTVTGTIASTLGAFSQSVAGGTGPSGSIASSLSAFTQSVQGGTGPSGTVASQLGAFSQSMSGGAGAAGPAAQALGAFTQSASGNVGASGPIANNLGAFNQATTGNVGASGTVASSLGAFDQSATGTFTPSTVSGTVNQPLGEFGQAATGNVGASGVASEGLGAFTQASTGNVGASGPVASQLGEFGQSASGGVGAGGSAAQQLGEFGQALSAGTGPTGQIASSLGEFAQSATGQYIFANVSGAIAQSLGEFTQALTGNVTAYGPISQSLGEFTQSALGGTGPSGSVSSSLGAFSQTATGTASLPTTSGTISQQLGEFNQVAFGAEGVTGNIVQAIGPFTSSATGNYIAAVTGTITQSLGAFQQNAVARVGAGLYELTNNPDRTVTALKEDRTEYTNREERFVTSTAEVRSVG